MIVVSDTSPILNLARIGCLDLLHTLYHRIFIPPAVYAELSVEGFELPDAIQIADAWVTVETPMNRAFVAELHLKLDQGEAEAIALAIERRADLILIDERRGRSIASQHGLSAMGLLGVLLEAKNAGALESVRTTLDRLIQEARFWIGDDLYRHVLKQAGES